MADDGFSLLNSSDESCLAFNNFFINPIGFAFGCYVLIILVIYLKNGKIKIKNAAYCAIISVSLQTFVLFTSIFLSNDLIIKWNYKDKNNFKLATFVDIINSVCYGIGKISFYFAFTFHVLSMFTDNNNDKKVIQFLKIWMLVIGITFVILIIIAATNDATSNTAKEIGLTSPHNIYIVMLVSHEGANMAKYAMGLAVLSDIIYFFVLIFLYIKKLKYLQKHHQIDDRQYFEIGTKGVNLVIFACITFWLFVIFILTDIPLKWWGGIDVTSDILCLFLMFGFNNNLYHNLCGYCHICWSKMLYKDQTFIVLDKLNENDEEI